MECEATSWGVREPVQSGRRVALVAQASDGELGRRLEPVVQVWSTRSGGALLETLGGRSPDLLVVDVDRLDGGGWRALEALHQRPPPDDIPILAVGDDPEGETLRRAFGLGASEFVRRDAPVAELHARVERVLERARSRRMLRALAQTDGLTGLANFRSLSQRLEEEFKRSLRYHHPMALVMLDLDNLKAINDLHGHEAGNRALLGFVRHLRNNLREVDFAARYGGDEFVVLLPHQTADEAAIFAERVRLQLKSLRLPARDDSDAELSLTVSIGLADHTPMQPCVSAPDLLDAADSALYAAKARGRDRLVIWSPRDDLSPGLPI